jgi:hypothetical protein
MSLCNRGCDVEGGLALNVPGRVEHSQQGGVAKLGKKPLKSSPEIFSREGDYTSCLLKVKLNINFHRLPLLLLF